MQSELRTNDGHPSHLDNGNAHNFRTIVQNGVRPTEICAAFNKESQATASFPNYDATSPRRSPRKHTDNGFSYSDDVTTNTTTGLASKTKSPTKSSKGKGRTKAKPKTKNQVTTFAASNKLHMRGQIFDGTVVYHHVVQPGETQEEVMNNLQYVRPLLPRNAHTCPECETYDMMITYLSNTLVQHRKRYRP
jgi:hypothetical protein